MKKRVEKKAQVAVFIILAIFLVGLVLTIFVVFRNNSSISTSDINNPQTYLSSCLKDSIEESVTLVLKQGGRINFGGLNPEPVEYNNEKINYLCYTYAEPNVLSWSESNSRCVATYGSLLYQIQNDITEKITPEVNLCFQNLRQNLIDNNYEVSLGNLNPEIETRVKPGKVEIIIKQNLTIKKGDDIRAFNNYKVGITTNLFELIVRVSSRILELSSDCPINRNIQIGIFGFREEMIELRDYIKIYSIIDGRTGETFKFAMRTCVPHWVIS